MRSMVLLSLPSTPLPPVAGWAQISSTAQICLHIFSPFSTAVRIRLGHGEDYSSDSDLTSVGEVRLQRLLRPLLSSPP